MKYKTKRQLIWKKTRLKHIYALVAAGSVVAAGLYPLARRFRIIITIKPIRRRAATDAAIIIISNQLNPFLGGDEPSPEASLAASVDWFESDCGWCSWACSPCWFPVPSPSCWFSPPSVAVFASSSSPSAAFESIIIKN